VTFLGYQLSQRGRERLLVATAVASSIALLTGCTHRESALSNWRNAHSSALDQYKADIARMATTLAAIGADGARPAATQAADVTSFEHACASVEADSSIAQSWRLPLTSTGSDAPQTGLSQLASGGISLLTACQTYAVAPTRINFEAITAKTALLQGRFHAWYQMLG